MRTLFTFLGITNLVVACVFIVPAPMVLGTLFLTAGALGGREPDYADQQ
jgi:hypothetical protein